MTKKNNRICIVCKKEYSYCNSCAEDRNKEPWHSIYCDRNCKSIFEASSDYIAGICNASDTKEKLDKCDLSNKEHFHAKILEAINELYSINIVTDESVESEIVAEDINKNVPVEESVFKYAKKEKFSKR